MYKNAELEKTYSIAFELKDILHSCPECSGNEKTTKQKLIAFFKKETDCEIHDCESWFYAVHRENNAATTIAFRADMDAVTGEDGSMAHLCGHDGHMSVVASLAVWASGRHFGKNIVFVFQCAEETGEGAKLCSSVCQTEKIDSIYAFHNCPSFEEGSILIADGCFACASLGLIINFKGRQTHAAYPENGINPVFPMAEFFNSWNSITDSSYYKGFVMATPVELKAGRHTFGIAAGEGQLCFTLRAWLSEDLEKLKNNFIEKAKAVNENSGIETAFEIVDSFPATVNSQTLYSKVLGIVKDNNLKWEKLDKPFRWSEDFGWYGKKTNSFIFGIGNGKDSAGLHTAQYKWNNEVTKSALQLFTCIIIGN